MFLLLGVTGNPYFYHSNIPVYFLLIALLILSFFNRVTADRRLLLVLLVFFVVQLIQFLQFGEFLFVSFFGLLAKIVVGYLSVKLISKKFIDVFLRQIRFYAIVSLTIFSLFLSGVIGSSFLQTLAQAIRSPFITQLDYNTSLSLVVFTVHPSLFEAFRNSGPFWEPGAYAIFLNLALVFELMKKGSLWTPRGRLFMITILTTLSTAGYFTLFFILITVVWKQKNKLLAPILITLFIGLGYVAYYHYDFLGAKVYKNLEVEKNASRFGSAKTDWQDFKKRPFFGWGRFHGVRGSEGIETFDDRHRNNGVTYLLSTYGFVVFLFYFIMLFTSIKSVPDFYRSDGFFSFVAFGAILISGFSQTIFLKDFFFALLFFPSVYSGFLKSDQISQMG